MNKIIEAAMFARAAHEGQLRKYNGQPYILHPARVAARTMLLAGVTESAVCAAWLHDTVEDCGTKVADIENYFGRECAFHVVDLTDPTKGSLAPRAERRKICCEHIGRGHPMSKRVKMLDRIDNLNDMAGSPAKFFSLYLAESRRLLEAVKDADAGLAVELGDLIVHLSAKL